jgi:hypothetical protein
MIDILRGLIAADRMTAIAVHELPSGAYRYAVREGFHRYYASVALGFVCVPMSVLPYFDVDAWARGEDA